jgi:hypothetical protein
MGGTNDGDRFHQLAANLKANYPNANVYLVDWSPWSTDKIGGFIPDAFKDAPNIDPAGHLAAEQLGAYRAAGQFDPLQSQIIGESFGNWVGYGIAKELGGVDRFLALNPANRLPYSPRDLREIARKSVALESSSYFDTHANIADYQISLETECSVQVWICAHTYGANLLRRLLEPNHPGGVDRRLLEFGWDFQSTPFGFMDGEMTADGRYVPTLIPQIKQLVLRFLEFLIGETIEELLDLVVSRDPNEKSGSQGVGAARYLSTSEPLRYVIQFENMSAATAPAQEVVISDQLNPSLVDLDTLSLSSVSFGDRLIDLPPNNGDFTSDVDLRPEQNLLVRIQATLNRQTGLLTWRFSSLDPDSGMPPEDPLAGFLPPNHNPPEGEGSVLFTIAPRTGLASGTEIRNAASIVFDLNSPIDTPFWKNTLDGTAPTSSVVALPSLASRNQFNVQWSGADQHAGIRSYTVYVSRDGGPFTVWLENVSQTSGMYAAEYGHTYGFYSVAEDAVGNREQPPSSPDAFTRVAYSIDTLIEAVTAYRASGDITTDKTAAKLLKSLAGIRQKLSTGKTRPAIAGLKKFAKQLSPLERKRQLSPTASAELRRLTDALIGTLSQGTVILRRVAAAHAAVLAPVCAFASRRGAARHPIEGEPNVPPHRTDSRRATRLDHRLGERPGGPVWGRLAAAPRGRTRLCCGGLPEAALHGLCGRS